MSGIVYRRSDCRLCHATDLELVLHLAPSPLPDAYVPARLLDEPQPSYPLDLYLCRSCGFAQLLDIAQPAAIYVDYIYETVSSLGLVEHFDSYAQDVISRLVPTPRTLVVDVGSNDGTLLRAFAKRGFTVLGIDPAYQIAEAASEAGIETVPDFFTVALARRLLADRGPAQVITANNVIANIDDLDEVMEAVAELLAPDGVFLFESFYLADLIRNMVFDFIYHEHISAFTVRSVDRFVRRFGLELIDVQRVATKGGSLRYTIQHAGGPRAVSPSIDELARLEASEGLDQPETFAAFAARIERAREAVLGHLRPLREDRRSIAGYGASATTTTLLHHFQLGDLIDYLVDDYAAKQGLYSPGLHLPVLTSDALYERRPDVVLVCAWRYYKPIIERNKRFLEQGGQFVVPLPELKVIE